MSAIVTNIVVIATITVTIVIVTVSSTCILSILFVLIEKQNELILLCFMTDMNTSLGGSFLQVSNEYTQMWSLWLSCWYRQSIFNPM
jgi:hypothetical protein